MSEESLAGTADRRFVIDRTYAAPRERVFEAWTDPDILALWWGPDGFDTPRAKVYIELRVGGRYDKVMVLRSPAIAAGMGVPVGAEFPDRAEIVELDPPALLVLRSEPQPDMGLVEATVTRVEFHEEAGGGTRVTLSDGPYTELMAGHAEAGWTGSFDKLGRLLDAS
jgi:uncharacterized protein YndB with AHSA1/START domain